jgi:hypothetical protein
MKPHVRTPPLLSFRALILPLVLGSALSGCAVARATGDTVEAIGVGVGQALGGVSSGAGHMIAGTGRAMSRAAGESSKTLRQASMNTGTPQEADLVF